MPHRWDLEGQQNTARASILMQNRYTGLALHLRRQGNLSEQPHANACAPSLDSAVKALLPAGTPASQCKLFCTDCQLRAAFTFDGRPEAQALA